MRSHVNVFYRLSLGKVRPSGKAGRLLGLVEHSLAGRNDSVGPWDTALSRAHEGVVN